MIAWVIGATGTWGEAVARELLGRGYDIVTLGRHETTSLTEPAWRLGRTVSCEKLDLVVPASTLEARLRAVLKAHGAPDVLFLCAAVTDGDLEAMIRGNYLGPVAVIRATTAAMMAAGRGGHLGVFLAQNARLGLAGIGAFSAGQAALWTWCEAFQAELGRAPEAAAQDGVAAVTLTRVIPPRAASPTQRWVSEKSGHGARLQPARAEKLVSAVLTGKRRAGRRPLLAGLSTLVR